MVLSTVSAVLLVFAAVYHRDTTSDLVGTWDLTEVDGHKLDMKSQPGDQLISFGLHADGTFDMKPSLGTWKVDGSNLVLHTNQYDGKTQTQFRAEMLAKYPSDSSMQKIAEKVFEDLKLSIGVDDSTLTMFLGGSKQTYIKRPTRQP